MEKMLKEVQLCKDIIMKHFNKPLQMKDENEQDFKTAICCHICDKKFVEKDIRVKDYCNITGKYSGSAHQDCNLKINPEKIKRPVIFYNLRGYDSHFIMQNIGKIAKMHTCKNKKGEDIEMNINAIPNNLEKYMTW